MKKSNKKKIVNVTDKSPNIRISAAAYKLLLQEAEEKDIPYTRLATKIILEHYENKKEAESKQEQENEQVEDEEEVCNKTAKEILKNVQFQKKENITLNDLIDNPELEEEYSEEIKKAFSNNEEFADLTNRVQATIRSFNSLGDYYSDMKEKMRQDHNNRELVEAINELKTEIKRSRKPIPGVDFIIDVNNVPNYSGRDLSVKYFPPKE